MMKLLNDLCASTRPALAVAIAGVLSALVMPTYADVTTISPSPIASTRSAQVKPNIMLLMDASSSMGYSHMPDEVEDKVTPISVGYKNYLCNSLYYKPSKDYSQVPRTYDGTEFAANLVTFTRAPFDIFVNGTADFRDLSANFRPYENGITTAGTYSLKQPDWPDAPSVAAYYYTFVPTNAGYTIDFNSPVCANADTGANRRALDGSGQDVGSWQRVTVGAGEQQNFANWYSYYRNRMLMTKTAVSRSFNAINASRRVGFITVEPNRQDAPPYNLQSSVQPEKFLALNDFTIEPGGQRQKWYAKLFAQTPKGFSPAREGLARVGRYYGNQFNGINQGMGGVDPMQYSCQQNFTIMTTDGYWNVRTESTNALLGGSYRGGPVQLDGITPVGNQDGNKTGPEGDTPPGVWDSAQSERRTTTDRLDTWSDVDCTGVGTFLKKTQTLSSSRPYTLTKTNTKRTRSQLESNTFNYTKKVDHFETQTRQYRLHSEQYLTQTLNYTLATTQKTRRTIPFTTKVDTYYTQAVQQLGEYVWDYRATKSYYTKQVFELHQTGIIQWYMTQYKQTLTRSQYTKEVTYDQRAVYHCNSRDGTDEHGTLSSTCMPSQGVTIDKIYDLPGGGTTTSQSAAWVNVPKGTCSQGYPSGTPRFQSAECRTVTDFALQAVQSCPEGTSDDSSSPFKRTVCKLTVLESKKPVASCQDGTNQTDAAGGYEIRFCETTQVMARGLMTDPTLGCQGGQSGPEYITTVCEHGPLWQDLSNSGVCTNPGPSGMPNYTYKTCNNQGPTTTYIPASSNCQATMGNFGSCTPGAVVGPDYVYNDVYGGGCVNGEMNNAPATAASYTNSCLGYRNLQNLTPVAACHHYPGYQYYTDTTPPYYTYYCQWRQNTNPTASAQCVNGPNTPNDGQYTTTTCAVTGPTTSYVADSSSCNQQTASGTNGGRTTTCNTPSESLVDDDGSCQGGTFGSGAGQYTVICGTRAIGAVALEYCVPGSTQDNGNGQSTTCNLALGQATPISTTCDEGDHTNPNGPNFTGSRCIYNHPTTDGVIPKCSVGTDPPTPQNGYKTSTCSVINPGVPQSVAASAATCSAGSPSVETQVGSTSTYSVCSYSVVQNTAPFAGTCTISATPTFDGTNSTTCGGANQTAWQPTETCSLANGGVSQNLTGSPYQVTNCRQSAITGVDYVVNVGDCVAATTKTPGNSYTLTDCFTDTHTDPSGVCVPGLEAPPTPGNNYLHTTCNVGSATTEAPANCNPGSTFDAGTGITTTCRKIDYAPGVLTNCTAGTSSTPTASDWITDVCYSQPGVAGKSRQYTETETVLVEQYSGNTLVSALAPVTTNVPGKVNVPTDGVCHIPELNPLTALPGPARPTTGMPNGCQSWACVASVPLVGGTYNSLADVAQYYYKTDLRPDMRDDGPYGVPHKSDGALDDRLPTQHMTTFTIALGVSGVLNYKDDYRSSATGDFADIKAGTKAWPIWPLRDPLNPANIDPAYYTSDSKWDDPRSIDDFWHTAVDGRGQYFSARDPNAVANGVTSALLGIDAAAASGSAVGYTTLEPVSGDNAAYVPYYQTYEWTGDVKARIVNLSNGTLGTTDIWSASDLLNQRTGAACDTRQIYLLRGGATPALTNFTWNTSTCNTLLQPAGAIADGLNSTEQAFFSDSNALRNLSQYPQMTTGTGGQREAAAGAALVNFLRGQSGKEQFQAGDNNKLFRTRSSRLGDIIDAQPMYVKTPFASYQDTDYIAFKAEKSNRLGMLYVAANDGMLHAFRATIDTSDQRAGQEEWAVIPSTVLPNLYKLADDNYRNQHQFFVNATPTIGDVRDTTRTGTAAWSTILVGGLGDGGAGFYALDVTDPLVPKALWEFKFSSTCYDANSDATKFADCNLGLSYSKPIITKLSDGSGKWVVMFTSGYNNVQTPGDGKGYLYVLDALTGKIRFTVPTGVGSTTTPSNLGQINNFVDDAQSDNSTLRVYGGDMYGKLWRFNVNGTPSATLIGTLKDPSDLAQPITTRPELAEVDGKPQILVGTGRLLGAPDVGDQQVQSIYSIQDTLATPSLGTPIYADVRAPLKKQALTQVNGTIKTRTVACASNCGSTVGWYVDLPDRGERVNVDMKLVLGSLIVGSNVPDASACSVGGYNWLNYFNFATGAAIADPDFGLRVSEQLESALLVGLNVIRPPTGKFVSSNRLSNGTNDDRAIPVVPPSPPGKRVSWREIPAQ